MSPTTFDLRKRTEGVASPTELAVAARTRGWQRDERPGALRPIAPRDAVCVVVIAVGVGFMTRAGIVGSHLARARPRTAPTQAVPSRPEATAFPHVGVARQTCEAGHSSGWHTHPGVHSVVVLSGTLTIYHQDCQRQDYGPGDVYLGGSSPHLARNESGQAVELAVTYVFATTSTVDPGSPALAPAGCEVS